jgi:vacuolar-type H+-ATPase subunit D/Vma8
MVSVSELLELYKDSLTKQINKIIARSNKIGKLINKALEEYAELFKEVQLLSKTLRNFIEDVAP